MGFRTGILLVGTVALLGCYHATIETGVAPSNLVIEKRWASGWILGLVPPSTVETAAKCESGVSKVETKLSFLNQLVGFLTLSIYTPMEIRVTCAEGMVSAPTSMMSSDSE
jgi:hypothetical protein